METLADSALCTAVLTDAASRTEIRQLTAQDFERSSALTAAAMRRGASRHYETDEVEALVRSHSSAAALSRPHCVAAVDGLRLLGVAAMDPDSIYQLQLLAVAPEHWRTGTGARLLQFVEHFLAARGARELRVAATLNAVPFYRACGYTPQRSMQVCLPAPAVAACSPWITVRAQALVKSLTQIHTPTVTREMRHG